MDIAHLKKKQLYILTGTLVMGAYSIVSFIMSGANWHGEVLTDIICQVIVSMIGGGLMGLFVFWIRSKITPNF